MLPTLLALAVFTASSTQLTPTSRGGVVVAPCPAPTAGAPVAGVGPTRRPKVVPPIVTPRTPPGLPQTTGVAHVEIRATVDVDGRPCDLVVTSQSHPGLGADTASLSAARQWRFEPASRDGGPVRATVGFAFRYEALPPQEKGESLEWRTGISVHHADHDTRLWSHQDLSPLP
jgi:TonB family protein